LSVFVLDRHKKPLMPCSEKRARLLLERGRARVHRMMPFTIRLTDRLVEDSVLQPIEIKLDPGSKATGIAVVRTSEIIDYTTGEVKKTVHIVSLIELVHRGAQLRRSEGRLLRALRSFVGSKALTARRQMRRRRRNQLRYRAPRFNNRGNKKAGWLPPSLQHRVDTTSAWVKRLTNLVPVTGIVQELMKFDMQKMQAQENKDKQENKDNNDQKNSPTIDGVQYQQGTLFGYEVREYLLEKFHRTCAYCDAQNIPYK